MGKEARDVRVGEKVFYREGPNMEEFRGAIFIVQSLRDGIAEVKKESDGSLSVIGASHLAPMNP